MAVGRRVSETNNESAVSVNISLQISSTIRFSLYRHYFMLSAPKNGGKKRNKKLRSVFTAA